MDVLVIRLLVMAVHIADVDDDLGMMHEYVIQHHKKYNVKAMFAENHHRKIANKLNLKKVNFNEIVSQNTNRK